MNNDDDSCYMLELNILQPMTDWLYLHPAIMDSRYCGHQIAVPRVSATTAVDCNPSIEKRRPEVKSKLFIFQDTPPTPPRLPSA